MFGNKKTVGSHFDLPASAKINAGVLKHPEPLLFINTNIDR
ncbi:hypothetical protein GMMP15_2000001 [Candidatus Magnetomoraceae bacterium gMMP-15]